MRDTIINDQRLGNLFSPQFLFSLLFLYQVFFFLVVRRNLSLKATPSFRPVETMVDFLRRQLQRRDSYEQFSSDGSEKRKSRLDLIRLSAVVCGIEFCYAAETAFVSPILLQIGLPIVFMTWTWCLPPLIGFFLVPILGSLSDKCSTRFGRRRPFIFLYSIGILAGLLLVANGK